MELREGSFTALFVLSPPEEAYERTLGQHTVPELGGAQVGQALQGDGGQLLGHQARDEEVLGVVVVEHRPRALRQGEAHARPQAVQVTVAVVRQVGPWYICLDNTRVPQQVILEN